jgi:hypothetical protein
MTGLNDRASESTLAYNVEARCGTLSNSFLESSRSLGGGVSTFASYYRSHLLVSFTGSYLIEVCALLFLFRSRWWALPQG